MSEANTPGKDLNHERAAQALAPREHERTKTRKKAFNVTSIRHPASSIIFFNMGCIQTLE
jgi:hypothetical protein